MKFRLGDVCQTNINSYTQSDNWRFVNYLDTGNITNNVIDEIQYIDLSNTKLPSRAKRKVNYNNIIYSTVRPNQKHFGIIKAQPENFLVSTGFVVIDVNEEKVIPDYLFYLLSGDDVTEKLHSIAEQSVSAYPSIKSSDIKNLEFDFPDIETQKRVVSVLNAIDNKISVNVNINKNLAA